MKKENKHLGTIHACEVDLDRETLYDGAEYNALVHDEIGQMAPIPQMTATLYEEILDYLDGEDLNKRQIVERIDEHPEGRKKLMSLWAREHEENGFPPRQTEQGYFFGLLAEDIITTNQYNILVGKL